MINISGIEYIEFYVGNILQACHFYETVLNFTPIAQCNYADDRISVLLNQNDIHIILTSSAAPNSSVVEHVHLHGDGVKDIAFATDDARLSFSDAINRGANVIQYPIVIEDANCKIIKATISTFGNTHHTFIERLDHSTTFLPNFKNYNNLYRDSVVGLQEIDHIAICVEKGTLNNWGEFYKNILGFHESYRENIYTGQSGMNSFVMQNILGNIKFTFLEPVEGVKKSQITDFLDYYKADGVQHIAFLSNNIINTVSTLRERGLKFLEIPETYYTELPNRVRNLKQNINLLKKQQILVDSDEDGFLFQIFSKVVHTRPTLFFEIVERQGKQDFGSANIKALFQAIEIERMKNEN